MREVFASEAVDDNEVNKLLELNIEFCRWKLSNCFGVTDCHKASHSMLVSRFSQMLFKNWQHLGQKFILDVRHLLL